jgi:hypothetical protein
VLCFGVVCGVPTVDEFDEFVGEGVLREAFLGRLDVGLHNIRDLGDWNEGK